MSNLFLFFPHTIFLQLRLPFTSFHPSLTLDLLCSCITSSPTGAAPIICDFFFFPLSYFPVFSPTFGLLLHLSDPSHPPVPPLCLRLYLTLSDTVCHSLLWTDKGCFVLSGPEWDGIRRENTGSTLLAAPQLTRRAREQTTVWCIPFLLATVDTNGFHISRLETDESC